jgi:hypothetical protein
MGMKPVILAVVALTGCTIIEPTVPVMPALGKSLADFANDKAICTKYADTTAGPAGEAFSRRQVGYTAADTAMLAGAMAGPPVVGATGAVVVHQIGDQSRLELDMLRRTYNIYYGQCMSSRGNQVPAI